MGTRTTLPTDRGQLGDLLVAELPWLVRLATRLTRDADVAEDCAQETIVGAWQRADQLRDPAALRGWLRRSLVNRVIDRARARHDELDIEAVETEWADDAWTVQPERVLERAELRDELEDALTRLPAILRIPVVLHDAVGWTSPEIAGALGIGLPAAKQRLRRGRMMLVSALAEDDGRRRASLAQPLRCWKARRNVSGYLDGELDDSTRQAVEDHLEACPTCPPLYAALVGARCPRSGRTQDPKDARHWPRRCSPSSKWRATRRCDTSSHPTPWISVSAQVYRRSSKPVVTQVGLVGARGLAPTLSRYP